MRLSLALLAVLLFSRSAGADELRDQLALVGSVQSSRGGATARVRAPGRAERRSVRRHGKERPRKQDDIMNLLEDAAEEDSREIAALLGMLVDVEQRHLGRSSSRGSAHAGTLEGGVQLPDHAAYVVRDRTRAWGAPHAVELLVEAFDQVLAADPGAPRVRVHDLSLRDGGPMDGHQSHQTGRDVDITYYRRTCSGPCAGRTVAPEELDAARQWLLLRHWLQRGSAEFIFIDYSLQAPLYEAARASGSTPMQLAQWFQYPRGPEYRTGIVRHVPNHANHVHVRFRCPAGDSACTETRTRRRSLSRDRAAPLLELVQGESERELLELLAD